jgi:uncharacterized membrane protein YdbT with pleckstrin-like domain
MSTFVVRPSLKPVFPWYLLSVGVLVWVAFVYARVRKLEVLHILVPALVLIRTAMAHSRTRFLKLTIESGKLRLERGLANHSIRTMELSKVQDIRVDRSMWQRLFGTGDLYIETAGESSSLVIQNIDSPQQVADQILDAARNQKLT